MHTHPRRTISVALLTALVTMLPFAVVAHPTVPQAKPIAGHSSSLSNPHSVTALAFSPDGSKLAAGGYQVVTLFDAATGRELTRFGGHPGAVTSLAFSPDGKLLVVAGGLPGKKGEVRVWDVSWAKSKGLWAVKTRPIVLDGPSDVVYSVAFSPNGKKLAAASYDHDVTLWDVRTVMAPKVQQRPSRQLRDHTDSVYGVAFSPDSRLLASCAGDRTVKVWNVDTGKRLYTLSESTAELFTIAFSPDGKRIAAGGADKTLRTWNVSPTAGTLAKSAFAHTGAILRVAFGNHGATVLTSGEDGAVKRWEAATLAEQRVYPKQPDWPQGLAVSPAGRLVAIGCQNGALSLYDMASGRLERTLSAGSAIAQKPADAQKNKPPTTSTIPGRRLGDQRQRRPVNNGGVTLFAASLGDMSPRGAERGKTTRFTLVGGLLGDALNVYFDDPAITGKIIPAASPTSGTVQADVAIGSNARLGLHRIYVQTPHGTTGALVFAVGGWPEVGQAEPNNSVENAQKIATPCTVVGALDSPGDTDYYQVEARAGEDLVFDVIAQPLRSRLQPVLTLMDSAGRVLAESRTQIGKLDTLLGYRFAQAGSYIIQLRDFESAGGGDVHYRLNVGEFPVVTNVFPLGGQKGTTVDVQVRGFNLNSLWVLPDQGDSVGGGTVTKVALPGEGGWNRFAAVTPPTSKGAIYATKVLAVGDDPEIMQQPDTDSLQKAQRVTVPCTINGRLSQQSLVLLPKKAIKPISHFYRFTAKKGQSLLLDVMARRLGSPLDSEIEILDTEGNPVERAVLRAVFQTEVTLSDRDSASTGIRIFAWDGVNVNDYMMVGREVLQVLEMPRGPDSDIFYRSYRGQRLGVVGTTPEFHSIGAPVYKVEIHPPGSTFSPNGYPLTHVNYRNDDGGPLFGKDSHLEFTPPRDGEYIVRLTDARGQNGEDYAYRLLIHPPRPDYRISMSPEHPNLPKGGSTTVTVECERYDGFNEPIEVRLEGLPPGFTATSSYIEPGETATTLLLSAAPEAVTPQRTDKTPSSIHVVASARIGGQEVVRAIEPDNGARLVTVMPNPDIRVATDRQEIVLHPGEETTVEAQIDRGKFGGRIPIDVRNLPFGVRVQDVGLNGVLVTEQDSARSFTIYCEPWVKPQTRSIYVIGNVEGGVSNAARPLTLRIEPKATARAAQKPGIARQRTLTKR